MEEETGRIRGKEPEDRIDEELLPEVQEERNRLFKKYITPNLNLVYKLCITYTTNQSNVQEYYTSALANLFRGITTYNPEKSLPCWIHITTKRHIWALEKKAWDEQCRQSDDIDVNDVDDVDDLLMATKHTSVIPTIENYREVLSDRTLQIFEKLSQLQRDGLLLQLQGYTNQEIADIESEKGLLKNNNVIVLKVRLSLARKFIREQLEIKHEQRQIGHFGETVSNRRIKDNPEDELFL